MDRVGRWRSVIFDDSNQATTSYCLTYLLCRLHLITAFICNSRLIIIINLFAQQTNTDVRFNGERRHLPGNQSVDSIQMFHPIEKWFAYDLRILIYVTNAGILQKHKFCESCIILQWRKIIFSSQAEFSKKAKPVLVTDHLTYPCKRFAFGSKFRRTSAVNQNFDRHCIKLGILVLPRSERNTDISLIKNRNRVYVRLHYSSTRAPHHFIAPLCILIAFVARLNIPSSVYEWCSYCSRWPPRVVSFRRSIACINLLISIH